MFGVYSKVLGEVCDFFSEVLGEVCDFVFTQYSALGNFFSAHSAA
jgi:hypothetical protein